MCNSVFFPCKLLLTSYIFTNRISKHNLYERIRAIFILQKFGEIYKLDFTHKAPVLKHDKLEFYFIM